MRDLHAYTLPHGSTILEAVEKIEENGSRTAILVEAGKAVAVVSEGDVMRALLRGIDVHAPALDVAQLHFRHLGSRDLDAALAAMTEHGLTLLPVVDEQMVLIDVISILEVLQQVTLE